MPAPAIWSPEQLVNTTKPLTQQNSTITALSGGGYVVAWDGPAGAGQPLSTYFQVYSAFNNPAGSEVAFSHPAGTSAPTVAALTDGGFVIAYVGQDEFGSFGIVAQTFDSGGMATGLSFTVNSEDDPFAPENQFFPVATALDNGGFAIAYRTDHSDGTYTIRMQRFAANGSKDGAETLVAFDPEGTVEQITIAKTGNGLFAVAWQSGDPVDNDIVMQIFRQTGAPQTGIFPATGSGHQSVPAIAADETGNFLLVYRSSSNNEMFAQIRSAEGALVKTHFQVSDPAQNSLAGGTPQVTAVHGGGWFVVWREFGMNSSPQIVGQFLDGAGNKLGDELLLADGGGGAATIGSYNVATLADGRIAISFDGVALTGEDTSGGSVRSMILDPRNGVITGTDAAETLVGSQANVNELFTAKDGNDDIYGNGGKDTIYGNGGNDTIRGGDGIDSLIGGSGDDMYIMFDAGDIVVEAVGGGNDTVAIIGHDYVLAAGLEIETLLLSNGGDYDLTGNEFGQLLKGDFSNNKLMGMGGNDTLDGSTNVDYMEGGTGDDLYLVDHEAEFIVEAAGGGTDTVQTKAVGFSLEFWDNVENLVVGGTGGVDGTGNSLANTLTGNSNDNKLFGLAGNDTLIGMGGADSLHGGSGDDTYEIADSGDVVVESQDQGTDTVNASIDYTLTPDVETLNLTGSAGLTGTGNALGNTLNGNSGANALNGLEGNDTLDGQGGSDTMAGGKNDDTYIVGAGDVVVEAANEGFDTVLVQFDYTLAANVEALSLIAGTNATGNELANALTGNAAANTLDGKAGDDTMTGGPGDDGYVVSDLGDVVVESVNAGFDTVFADIDHTLADNVEALVLTGSAAKGTGNGAANMLMGNAAANTLSGGGGSDAMTGGGGKDSLVGGKGNDTMDGGAGKDTLEGGRGDDTYVLGKSKDMVLDAKGAADTITSTITRKLAAFTGIENLTLVGTGNSNGTGNGAANDLVSNSGKNRLKGEAGDDLLRGLGGADQLWGGAGKDVFDFDAISDIRKAAGKRDIIKDFQHLADKIDLKSIDANTIAAGDQKFKLMAAEGKAFTGVAGQMTWNQKDLSGTSKDVTLVSGDINGDGVADFTLELTGLVSLSKGDFIL